MLGEPMVVCLASPSANSPIRPLRTTADIFDGLAALSGSNDVGLNGVVGRVHRNALWMRLVAGGFDLGNPTATDPVERKSSRPDFVASMCTWAHGGTTSPYKFTTDTPPVYLCHAQDDPSAPFVVATQIDQALQALHILEHLEVYPTGGHDGFHVGDPNAPNRTWPVKYLAWLHTNNIIP